jgi:hypothetical protein
VSLCIFGYLSEIKGFLPEEARSLPEASMALNDFDQN